jgi:hypothetical protein
VAVAREGRPHERRRAEAATDTLEIVPFDDST